MNTGDRIKTLRIAKGLTQEELGKLVGVKKAAIQKYEKGTVENIKRSVIVALANNLDTSPCELMGWSDINVESNNKPTLSDTESTLLNEFNKLDASDKNKVINYTKDLSNSIKYLNTENFTIAAHDDDLTLEEKNVMDERIKEFMKNKK